MGTHYILQVQPGPGKRRPLGGPSTAGGGGPPGACLTNNTLSGDRRTWSGVFFKASDSAQLSDSISATPIYYHCRQRLLFVGPLTLFPPPSFPSLRHYLAVRSLAFAPPKRSPLVTAALLRHDPASQPSSRAHHHGKNGGDTGWSQTASHV